MACWYSPFTNSRNCLIYSSPHSSFSASFHDASIFTSASCSLMESSLYRAFRLQNILFARSTSPVVAAHGAVTPYDTVARNTFVVIGAHDGTHGTRGLCGAGLCSNLFIRHHLPFRDLPHDIAHPFHK